MSTFRNPVGPQPSRVYWRRRLLVGLGLLAIIVIVMLIVFQPRSGDPTASVDPSESPSPSETASDDPEDAAACDLDKVSLEPVTDATSYSADQDPLLSFAVKSTMTVPCVIPSGTDIQEYRITSGEELIWSSKHCQVDPVEAELVLMPGVPVSPAAIPWDRTRSSTETCEAERDPVIAGGASYHLSIIIGELESEETKQFLLH